LPGDHDIERSMSRVENGYDNAIKERFWISFRLKAVNGRGFKTIEEARVLVFEYIEVYYDREGKHSSLACIRPESFEASLN